MIGAIIGDIAGSRFEFHNHRSKDFELFSSKCFFTDDSVMTLAIAQAVMNWREEQEQTPQRLSAHAVHAMRDVGRHYPHCGYGGRFMGWLNDSAAGPYHSWGNGAAMRVSAAAWAARDEQELKRITQAVTEVTHNHLEGLKGAEATALCIWLARRGASKADIRRRVEADYYPLDFTVDGIRPHYTFNETCQGTVPQAIQAFLEGDNFEDAIRTAVSLGGDSDTLAAITGSIAEGYWGVPTLMKEAALS